MYETLIPDVMAPEAHQNNRSSVRELSGLTFDSLSMVGGYTEDLKTKQHKTVKLGGGHLLRGGRLLRGGHLLGQYGMCSFYS